LEEIRKQSHANGAPGLNLFQSTFTNWCPMMSILRKAGAKARRRK
jgi:hypothetical protein